MDHISFIFGWTLGIMGVILILKPFVIRHSGKQREVKEARDTILQILGGLLAYWGYTLLAPGTAITAMGPLVFILGGVAMVWSYLILIQKIRQYEERQEALLAQELSLYADQLRKKKEKASSLASEKKEEP